MSEEMMRRYVAGYRNIAITDDYGVYMYLGDIVEIHVMPCDYTVIGTLRFSEEECVYYVECDYGKVSLSHYDEDFDMGATICVRKTFRKKEAYK